MRKLLAALALAALMVSVPGISGAVGYEDSLDDCRYPAMFDLMIMRPISLTATLFGTVLSIPAVPFAYLTAPADAGQVPETLIYSPARFTFSRSLGECVGTTVGY